MTNTTPSPTTPSPTTQAPATQAPSGHEGRLPARPGTIVWGGILLLIAAIAATATFVDATIYTPRFVLWTIVGFGGLLVLAGIVGAVARVTTSTTDRQDTSQLP